MLAAIMPFFVFAMSKSLVILVYIWAQIIPLYFCSKAF